MVLLAVLITGIGAAGIVAPIEFLRRYMPRYYFGLSEIIHGIDRNITWPAISVRFGIPLIVGIVLGLGVREDQLIVSSAAAFLAALLLVWPMFLHPELTDPRLLSRRRQLLLIYVMFISTYAVLGLAGGQLGKYLREALTPAFEGKTASQVFDALKSEAVQLLRGAISGAVGILLIGAWNWYRNRVQDDARNKPS